MRWWNNEEYKEREEASDLEENKEAFRMEPFASNGEGRRIAKEKA